MVKAYLISVLAAAMLASGTVHAGTAPATDTEPEIESWMLPPDTRPVWGLLDSERVHGSGPLREQADSLTGNWGGYRDWIATNTAWLWRATTLECAGNPVGGMRQGALHPQHRSALSPISKVARHPDMAFSHRRRTELEPACRRTTSATSTRSSDLRRRSGWCISLRARRSSVESSASSRGESMASTTSSPRPSTATPRTSPSAAIRSAFPPTSTFRAIRTPCGAHACAGSRIRSGTPWGACTTPSPVFAPTSSTVSISASATIRASSASWRPASCRSKSASCREISQDTSRSVGTTTPSR